MTQPPGIVVDEATTATVGRKVGYGVAIGVNAVVLFVANNILAWDILPWLTDDFEQLLPIINAAIVVSIAVNTVYLVWDPTWLKLLGDIATSALSIAVAYQTWQVFPFDFGASSWDWETIIRIVLIIGIVGPAIAIVVQAARLVGVIATSALEMDH